MESASIEYYQPSHLQSHYIYFYIYYKYNGRVRRRYGNHSRRTSNDFGRIGSHRYKRRILVVACSSHSNHTRFDWENVVQHYYYYYGCGGGCDDPNIVVGCAACRDAAFDHQCHNILIHGPPRRNHASVRTRTTKRQCGYLCATETTTESTVTTSNETETTSDPWQSWYQHGGWDIVIPSDQVILENGISIASFIDAVLDHRSNIQQYQQRHSRTNTWAIIPTTPTHASIINTIENWWWWWCYR